MGVENADASKTAQRSIVRGTVRHSGGYNKEA